MRHFLRSAHCIVASHLCPVSHSIPRVLPGVSAVNRCFSQNNWGSKKQHRKVPLFTFRADRMADPNIEKQLEPLRLAVKEQVSRFYVSGRFKKFTDFVFTG